MGGMSNLLNVVVQVSALRIALISQTGNTGIWDSPNIRSNTAQTTLQSHNGHVFVILS